MGLITSVVEVADERGGRISQGFQREYTRVFLVTTAGPGVDSGTVMFAPGLPSLNAPYITNVFVDTAAIVRDIQPRPAVGADDPTLWRVTVIYSTKALDPQRQNQDQNETPLTEPPKVFWGNERGTKPFARGRVDLDQNGKVINAALQPLVCATNGEPFDPVPEIAQTRLSLTFVRNEATFDSFDAYYYLDTVNNDQFCGFSPRQARCVEYTGERDFKKGVSFYVVRRVFAFRTPSWDMELPNTGSFYKDNITGKRYSFVDSAGNVMRRGKLDANGNKLADGAADTFRWFAPYQAVDYAPLNIQV
jgi:hypothetical protein